MDHLIRAATPGYLSALFVQQNVRPSERRRLTPQNPAHPSALLRPGAPPGQEGQLKPGHWVCGSRRKGPEQGRRKRGGRLRGPQAGVAEMPARRGCGEGGLCDDPWKGGGGEGSPPNRGRLVESIYPVHSGSLEQAECVQEGEDFQERHIRHGDRHLAGLTSIRSPLRLLRISSLGPSLRRSGGSPAGAHRAPTETGRRWARFGLRPRARSTLLRAPPTPSTCLLVSIV